MNGVLMDGRKLAAKVVSGLKEEIKTLREEEGIVPGLAVILAGENPASRIYVNIKEKTCREAGIRSYKHTLEESSSTAKVLALIAELNRDDNVHGILVQLPLPGQIDKDRVIQSVDPLKDVDGFHPLNLGRLFSDRETFIPCTPLGIMGLLSEYGVSLAGKEACVLGRSIIVGKPLAVLLLREHATVTLCHSRTTDLGKVTSRADVLIAAAGRPRLVKKEMVKDGAVVIDVGVNRLEDNTLCGDVDFKEVKEKASLITPVPGGVGPMTIAMLMKNTLRAAKQKKREK